MSEQVQELIDKIKAEGVAAVQQRAKEIEAVAQKKAQEILREAQQRTEKMLRETQSEIKKSQEAAEMAIKQAARDTLLSLRKEINRLLNRIVAQEVSGALSAEQTSRIIEAVVKGFAPRSSDKEIKVVLNPADLKILKNGALIKLQKELKNSLTIQSSEDIHKGFTISFDAGKSYFDFSDASLAEYMGSFLNEELGQLLKEAVQD